MPRYKFKLVENSLYSPNGRGFFFIWYNASDTLGGISVSLSGDNAVYLVKTASFTVP